MLREFHYSSVQLQLTITKKKDPTGTIEKGRRGKESCNRSQVNWGERSHYVKKRVRGKERKLAASAFLSSRKGGGGGGIGKGHRLYFEERARKKKKGGVDGSRRAPSNISVKLHIKMARGGEKRPERREPLLD